MRHTAVAVIGFGCAIGVFAAAGTIPASASVAGRNDASSVSGAGALANATGGVPADQTRGTPSSQAKTVATSKLRTTATSKLRTTAASKLKTVEYDGYSVTVPSSWPVFHLDTDPAQCVRYDINAVYLGNPGANQNCPSNLIGRVQTITITDAGASPMPRALYERAAVAHGGLGAALPSSAGGQLWDRNGNLNGTPYLPPSRWASDRDKQYAGNKTQKIGGYTINIDANRVGGAVAGP